MSLEAAVRTCLSKYVEFEGRAIRSEYWFWVLFVLIVNIIAGIVDFLLFGSDAQVGFTTLVGLALLLPGLAVSVRRLHDLDRSGWWLLIVLIPLIGWLVLIYWFVQRGTDGANRFGPAAI